MLKKVLASTLLMGLIGLLVFGAINRTLDRTDRVVEAQGNGYGRGRAAEEVNVGGDNGGGRATEETNLRGGNGTGRSTDADAQQGRGGNGQRGGQGNAAYETLPETWQIYEGVVVQVPEPGVELVIETNDGAELVIGTGPMNLAAEGFALQAGEALQVHGYWEANEFKAAQLTRLSTGQSLALRDEFGRPAWAGRNAQAGAQAGLDQRPSANASGSGEAQVDAWLQIQGRVVSVDQAALIVETVDDGQIAIEGRPWQFAQEQGFSAQAGDEVTLTGFYEGEAFEVGRIEDTSIGQTVLLRDENGRPMWAGRGRRGA